MSSVMRQPRRLERHRAKIKGKKIAQQPGKGKAEVRAAKVVNLEAALALKKKSGKAAREFDSMDVSALQEKLAETRKELFNLRFKHATGQLDRVSDIPAAKRRIARILTLIKQKEVRA